MNNLNATVMDLERAYNTIDGIETRYHIDKKHKSIDMTIRLMTIRTSLGVAIKLLKKIGGR